MGNYGLQFLAVIVRPDRATGEQHTERCNRAEQRGAEDCTSADCCRQSHGAHQISPVAVTSGAAAAAAARRERVSLLTAR
jgi:hypothetical protein